MVVRCADRVRAASRVRADCGPEHCGAGAPSGDAAYPALAGLRMARIWGGWINSTPDGVPVISPIEALPGFFLAAGFSGHGFGIGPAAGRLAADQVAGDRPIVDPTSFRHARLVDGTDLGCPGMM